MIINKKTTFCMNNSKLCQELFANHFEVGYVMIHDVAKDRTVEFSVNPLDKRQVRFTYFDRMVHDALYTIYQDYLNKNEGARNGCEINYQLLLKVMTGNSQQTNLKREGSLRLVLRDSLFKLAATDIYIDASIRGARTKPNVFFGKLVNLEQLPQAAEGSENAKRHDDRFVISGNMPLFDYANSIGRRSGQIVYYPAEAMGYAVAKLDRAEGNFPRELIVLSKPDEAVTYGRKAEADPEPQEVYRNTVNRMMIKHYMMRKIMVIRRGKCPENFKIVNYLSTLNPRKNPGSQGMVMDLFGTYYKLHSRCGENSAEMIHHFSTDSEKNRDIIVKEVAEYTEALLCTWLYYGFIIDAVKNKDGKKVTGVTLRDTNEFLDVLFFEPKESDDFEKVYCHIEERNSGNNFFEEASENERCRKMYGKYIYDLNKLTGSKLVFQMGMYYKVTFISDKQKLCSGSFVYPDEVRKVFKSK